MNILIVDDHATNLKLLRTVLEFEGATVCEASDGVEALGVLQRERVDAIISDILMPRMDGYRLCMEVRASAQSHDVPFIAYSANYLSAGDEKLMMEMGADRFLRKPVSAAVLATTFREVVDARRARPPSPARIRPEPELLQEYNHRLVVRLDEKNADLMARLDRSIPTEDKASSTEGWLRPAFAQAPAVYYVLNCDNRKVVLRTVSRSITQFLGFTVAEAISPEWWHRQIHPDDAARALRSISETPNEQSVGLEYRLRHKDGSTRWVQDQRRANRGANVPPVDLIGVWTDITARKCLEVEAVARQDQLKSLLALQHAVTVVIAEAASPSETNQKILATLGSALDWDFGELWTIDTTAPVLKCNESWHAPSREAHAFAAGNKKVTFRAEQGLPGRVWALGQAVLCADLTQDPACPRDKQASSCGLRSWVGFPIKLRLEVVGVIGFFSRKTLLPDPQLWALFDTLGLQLGLFIEGEQLAIQFRQAQKMQALGTLAGGIAHDFNNILAAIDGFSELAVKEAAGNVSLIEHLNGVSRGVERANALVRQILGFSSPQRDQRRPIDLRQITTEAMRLLRAAVPSEIEFQTVLGKDVPTVLADVTQVHQVLLNLVINGAHAMREKGGCLTLTLENCVVDEKFAFANPDLRPGCYALLTVRDTGHGMETQTLEHIFEPFFSTKPRGEGTGLGLSVVHGIVKSHKGAITVCSRPGVGTTFKVYLPASAPETVKVSPIRAGLPHGAGELILLVDDEITIATIGKQVLNSIGYRTHTCTNAVEALEFMRADPSACALVITDQNMGGTTGTDLAQRLTAIRPDLPVILMSGNAVALQTDRSQTIGKRRVLAKPFTMHQLAIAVHDMLSPSPAT